MSEKSFSKLERARIHFEEFKTLYSSYIKNDPVLIWIDSSNWITRYIVTSEITQPSKYMMIVFWDILHNLKSHLDHIAYNMICIQEGNNWPHEWIYFPISESLLRYNLWKFKALWISNKLSIPPIKQGFIDILDSINPYKWWNNALWNLHKLNIIDKHRLILVAQAWLHAVDLWKHVMSIFSKSMPEFTWMGSLSLFVEPADTKFPLKKWDILFEDSSNTPTDMQFTFKLVFMEPDIGVWISLIDTINDIMNTVTDVSTQLTTYLETFPESKFF